MKLDEFPIVSEERYRVGDGVVEYQDGSTSTSVMFFLLSSELMSFTDYEFSKLWSHVYPGNAVTADDIALSMVLAAGHVDINHMAMLKESGDFLYKLCDDIGRAGYPELSEAVIKLSNGRWI